MHKVKLKDAELCLAELVKEAANGEEIIITQDDGTAFKLTRITDVPNASESKLYNPEGLWDQSVSSQDIAEARKEMWQKFDRIQTADIETLW